MTEIAALSALYGRGADARTIVVLVASLQPFARHELAGFFTVSKRPEGEPEPSSHSEQLSVRGLAKVIRGASQLLSAAGSAAKARDLSQAANDLDECGDLPVHRLLGRVKESQEEARQREIDEFVSRLRGLERDAGGFEKIVKELEAKQPPTVNAVAVGYVQGKSKYPSKPKALAAIRDKRFERARLATKMGERP
ncbi:MAG: hypothetical protein WAU68_17390 [Vitreimonas sp.]